VLTVTVLKLLEEERLASSIDAVVLFGESVFYKSVLKDSRITGVLETGPLLLMQKGTEKAET
jgi:hypothetical protein